MIPYFIALVMLGVALWRPRHAVSLLILFWPSYLLRTSALGIPTTVLELSLYAVVVAVAVRLMIKKTPWHWVYMTRMTWILLGLWVFAWLLAAVLAADQSAAWGAVKAWLVDPLLFSAVMAIIIKTEQDRLWLMRAAVLSGTIVALAGLVQVIWLRSTLQEGRLSSFFHPVANYAAMYLGPLLIFSTGLLLFGVLRDRRWWIAVGVIALALLFTVSYGGYLAVGVASLFVWHYFPASSRKRKITVAAVILMVFGISVLVSTPNFRQHFNTSDRSSGLVRGQIWQASWYLIKQRPVVGIGPNNFEAAYRETIPKIVFPPLEWLVAQPHNLYLALWLETGLLGLLVFLVLLKYHFYLAWRDFLPAPTQRGITIASLGALLVITVHGLVDTPFFKNDLVMQFMFLAVLPWLGQTKNFHLREKK